MYIEGNETLQYASNSYLRNNNTRPVGRCRSEVRVINRYLVVLTKVVGLSIKSEFPLSVLADILLGIGYIFYNIFCNIFIYIKCQAN